jgi:hypothetical protein
MSGMDMASDPANQQVAEYRTNEWIGANIEIIFGIPSAESL